MVSKGGKQQGVLADVSNVGLGDGGQQHREQPGASSKQPVVTFTRKGRSSKVTCDSGYRSQYDSARCSQTSQHRLDCLTFASSLGVQAPQSFPEAALADEAAAPQLATPCQAPTASVRPTQIQTPQSAACGSPYSPADPSIQDQAEHQGAERQQQEPAAPKQGAAAGGRGAGKYPRKVAQSGKDARDALLHAHMAHMRAYFAEVCARTPPPLGSPCMHAVTPAVQRQSAWALLDASLRGGSGWKEFQKDILPPLHSCRRHTHVWPPLRVARACCCGLPNTIHTRHRAQHMIPKLV